VLVACQQNPNRIEMFLTEIKMLLNEVEFGCRAAMSAPRYRRLAPNGPSAMAPAGTDRGAPPLYNWPYLLSTSRQLFPTRKLCAARVALQRSRLLQVMPPLRSQNLAAAGRQGARSFMSRAPAIVLDRARKRKVAMNLFIRSRSLLQTDSAADRFCLGANAGNDHPNTADANTKFAQVF
jgi:hypothetical protein